jgi:predicted PurR-regulated permease PerM
VKRSFTDLLLSLILAVGIFTVCKTEIKPPISSEILAGLIIFIVGLVLSLLCKRGTLLKRLARIVSITGAVLAIGTFVMVFSMLGRSLF